MVNASPLIRNEDLEFNLPMVTIVSVGTICGILEGAFRNGEKACRCTYGRFFV